MRAFPACTFLAWALLSGAGCEDTSVSLVDGGVARRLEILDPPGAQIGLRYGRFIDLQVRATLDDSSRVPLQDEPVRFAIFGDPAGSTLGRDVVNTDDEGVARVTLTAGNQEGSFRVHASASGAADVEFAVSTSMLEFVELDAQLADPLPSPGARSLSALLYDDRTCAAIVPMPTPTGAARTLAQPAVAQATMSFVNLLSRRYALVGRVEDKGRLVAHGCVDVDPALAHGGAHLLVPVRMYAVSPDVTGSFDLTTQLRTARAMRSDAAFAVIDLIDHCPAHLGQLLLDELVQRTNPARAAQIEAQRGTAVAQGTYECRPDQLAAGSSLDGELATLLSQGPGAERAALIADLDALLGAGELRSTLSLSPSAPLPEDGAQAPQRLVGEHRARQVVLGLGNATCDYDLLALGIPVLAARGIAAELEANQLRVGEHALPIELPALWGMCYGELSIAVRQPMLPTDTLSAWFAASVASAQRSAKTGCAAVENLVCERTDPSGCTGTLEAACEASVAAVGTRFDAMFASGVPLRLSGSARVVDDMGDLRGDHLVDGNWDESAALFSTLSFSGPRGGQ